MIRAWLIYYLAEFLDWFDNHINHPVENVILEVWGDYDLGWQICRRTQMFWVDVQDMLGTDDMGWGDYGWPTEEMTWHK